MGYDVKLLLLLSSEPEFIEKWNGCIDEVGNYAFNKAGERVHFCAKFIGMHKEYVGMEKKKYTDTLRTSFWSGAKMQDRAARNFVSSYRQPYNPGLKFVTWLAINNEALTELKKWWQAATYLYNTTPVKDENNLTDEPYIEQANAMWETVNGLAYSLFPEDRDEISEHLLPWLDNDDA